MPPRHSTRSALPAFPTLLATAAATVAISGCGDSSHSGTTSASPGSGGTRSTATAPPTGPGVAPGDPSPAYENAAQRALPSVVQISGQGRLGSGIVFNDRGDIVTNAHVVAGAQTFQVVSTDGRRHKATLRGAFPAGDLAVVHVQDGGSLQPARFGDSSKLKVGEAVLALGSPLGFQSSVTDGIVSAVSRTVSEGNGVALPSVVQTSAPINPGNSGGALVDLSATVVGIPTLAAADPQLGGGAAPGVGFAISSNTVRRIATQLVDSGKVVSSGRAYLGVELGSLPGGGVLVASVRPGGPAAAAGIKPGDIIVSVDGRPVMSVDDLAITLAEHRPGDRVPVEIQRQDGSRATVQVTLGELPAGR